MLSAAIFLMPVLAYGFLSIGPEELAQVEMSSTDVNRIICAGGEIKDVVYSKEKGLTVKVMGSDAFVKFPVLQKDDKLAYADSPMEVYISCGDAVYSIIASPKKIPPVTVQIEDRKRRLRENLSLFKGLAFEDKVLRLIKYAYLEEYPDSFAVEAATGESSQPDIKYTSLDVRLRKKVKVDGEGLVLYEYLITPENDMELRETDFIPLAKRPVSIAIESTAVSKGGNYRLFVVDYPVMQAGARMPGGKTGETNRK